MVFPSQVNVHTGIENLTRVHRGGAETDLRIGLDVDEQVLGHLAVPVETEGQSVVEEAGIKAEVGLLGSLPRQIWVSQAGRCCTCGSLVGKVVIATEADGRLILIATEDVDVTVASPGSTQLQERHSLRADGVLEEFLIADGPASRDRGEGTPAVVSRQLRRVKGIAADVELEEIALIVVIRQTAEVRKLCSIRRVGC